MLNNFYEPAILVQHIRDGLIEREHRGFVVLKKNNTYKTIGNSKNYPIYLRSCAKPLQATLMIDENLDKKFNLTSEEIAICCASHAGEKCHVKTAKNLTKKFKLKKNQIKCGFHKPLAKSVKTNKNSVFFNNCVGKHILMLALCKHFGYDLETYYEKTHPLQEKLTKKIGELCEYTDFSHITKDGCGVPIIAMPLENMVTGYINLFCNTKYEKIKQAFQNHPYLIGGEDRTDTHIMQNTENLIAKVGAEGLCVVVNTQEKSGFVVDILDSNMQAREFVVLNLINKLGWGNLKINDNIKNLHDEILGKLITNIEF